MANEPIREGFDVFVHDGDKTVDMVNCDPAALRRIRQTRVAMVFQQFGLLPWRTVEENVGFGLELSGVPEGYVQATSRKASSSASRSFKANIGPRPPRVAQTTPPE